MVKQTAAKNVLLKENLANIEARIATANNLNDLLKVVKLIKLAKLTVISDKQVIFITGFLVLIFIAGLLFFGFCWSKLPVATLRGVFKVLFGGILFTMVLAIFATIKNNNTNKIADLLLLKKVALDNELVFDQSDKEQVLEFLQNMFFIFNNGDEQELSEYIKGKYQNKLIYHYFHFHYVNSDPRIKANAEDVGSDPEDFDLYGIITPFNIKNFIKISNYETAVDFINWKSSSIFFNKTFKVYTDDEQAVAIFLQPKVIEQIEQLYETFPELDIELSNKGFLALSTPDEELLNCTRQYDLDQLELFTQEIKGVLKQIKLHKALEFINFLKEYHQQT